MNWLSGKKTYIGIVAGLIIGLLYELDVLGSEIAGTLGALVLAWTGVAVRLAISKSGQAAVVVLCVLGLSGCSGYESSPWGPTQKANPGWRAQVNPATGKVDVGVTSDMNFKADLLKFKKDGIEFEGKKLDASSAASPVRREDVGQLTATGVIQQIHWAGFNQGLATVMPFVSAVASRPEVPQDVRESAMRILAQQVVPAITGVSPPAASPEDLQALTDAIRKINERLDAMTEPTTQPVE